MNIILNFLALGDFVISQSVLIHYLESKKSSSNDWLFIGSEENAYLSKLLFSQRINVKYDSVVSSIPPLFNVRNSSILDVTNSLFLLRKKINAYRDPVNTFFCEKKDFRYSLICNSNNIKWPKAKSNIYSDRYNCFFSDNIDIDSLAKPLSDCKNSLKTILINPHSRMGKKELKEEDLLLILETLRYYLPSTIISLFDFDDKYSKCHIYADRVIKYSTLHDSVRTLKDSSFYIGADSLFLHLGYFFNIPTLAIYNNYLNDYFSPPGLISSERFLVSKYKNLSTLDVEKALKRICSQ